MPLFHDLETLSFPDLIEQHIMKLMHNIYSYHKPEFLANTWTLKAIKHNYLLRSPIQFDIPLVRSIRLSSMPQFKFPSVFNSFPGDFQCIMEREDFLTRLYKYYFAKYKIDNCSKRFCKYCSYDLWKKQKLSLRSFSSKPLSYIKYE